MAALLVVIILPIQIQFVNILKIAKHEFRIRAFPSNLGKDNTL